MDIDKLTQKLIKGREHLGFSTLLDIDKLTQIFNCTPCQLSFSTLLDIDKLTLHWHRRLLVRVLVLCWILINLHTFDLKLL